MSHETDDQPLVGAPLTDAEDASIDPAKLRLYALDREHPVGRHKAAVFLRALGIGSDDWEYLRDEILAALPNNPVTTIREPRTAHEGYTYEVLVPVTGLGEKAQRTLKVITAWEIRDDRPVLVTVRVAPQNRQ
jgi:hypothetical protein